MSIKFFLVHLLSTIIHKKLLSKPNDTNKNRMDTIRSLVY